MLASVGLQFALHLSSLVYSVSVANQYMPKGDKKIDPDGKFEPNIVNSVRPPDL